MTEFVLARLLFYALAGFGIIATLVAGFLIWYVKYNERSRLEKRGLIKREEENGYVTESEIKRMLTSWCANCTVTAEIIKRLDKIEQMIAQAESDRIRERAEDASDKVKEEAATVMEKKVLAEGLVVSKKEDVKKFDSVEIMISKIAESVAILAFSVRDKAKREGILREMWTLQRMSK